MLHLQLFFSETVGVMSFIGLVKAPFLGVNTFLHSPNARIKAVELLFAIEISFGMILLTLSLPHYVSSSSLGAKALL
jgi:hypothetical protein